MTNTEIIATIRNEIERRIKLYSVTNEKEQWIVNTYWSVLSFLSTLESEKPMNQEGLEEEINRLWESFADEMEGPHNLFNIYARLARHFAKWGAERQKEQDLAEMAQSKSPLSVAYANRCFENGKQAMKGQMLKEAVEADVMLTLHDKTGDVSLHTGYLPKELGIKCDDKVRIIIVKEDSHE